MTDQDDDLFIPTQYSSDEEIMSAPAFEESIPVMTTVVAPRVKKSKKTKRAKPSPTSKKSATKKGKKEWNDRELAFIEKLIEENKKAPPLPKKETGSQVSDENLKELKNKLKDKMEAKKNVKKGVVTPTIVVKQPAAAGGSLKIRTHDRVESATTKLLRLYEPKILSGAITVAEAIELASKGIDPTGQVRGEIPAQLAQKQMPTDVRQRYYDHDQIAELIMLERDLITSPDANVNATLEKLTIVRQALKERQRTHLDTMMNYYMNEVCYAEGMVAVKAMERGMTNFDKENDIAWNAMATKVFNCHHAMLKTQPDYARTADKPKAEVFYEELLKQLIGDEAHELLVEMDSQQLFSKTNKRIVLVGMQKNFIDLFPRLEGMAPLDKLIEQKLVPPNMGTFTPFDEFPFAHVLFWSFSRKYAFLGSFYRSKTVVDGVVRHGYKKYWLTFSRHEILSRLECGTVSRITLNSGEIRQIDVVMAHNESMPKKDLLDSIKRDFLKWFDLEMRADPTRTADEVAHAIRIKSRRIPIFNVDDVLMGHIKIETNEQQDSTVASCYFEQWVSREYRKAACDVLAAYLNQQQAAN